MDFYWNLYPKRLAITNRSHILIIKLLVSNIPDDMDEHKLFDYFRDFGEILNFKMCRNDLWNRREAYVTYKDPLVASEVIWKYNRNEDFACKVLSAVPCDNWLQPPLYYLTEEDEIRMTKHLTKEDETAIISTNHKSIMNLDDDCLFNIYKYLDLKTKLAFALSDRKFIPMIKHFGKSHLNNVDRFQMRIFSVWQQHAFLNLIGDYITKMDILILNPTTAKLFKFYCPKLKKLSIESKITIGDDWNLIPTNLSNLQALHLKNCDISNEFIDLLKNLTELEHLTLVKCERITGENLRNVINLKKLDIIECSKLVIFELKAALFEMPLLTSFYFIDERSVYEALDLSIYCKDLEVLYTDCSIMRPDSISNLEKLKSLYIKDLNELATLSRRRNEQIISLGIIRNYYDDQLDLEHCRKIARFVNLQQLHCQIPNDNYLNTLSSLNNLIELKLSFSKVTNEGVLNIIKKCRNLKWINLHGTRINKNFPRELLPIIENYPRSGRLTLLVYYTEMLKSELPEEYNTDEMKFLVEFVFEEIKSHKSYDQSMDFFDKYVPTGESFFFQYVTEHYFDIRN